MKRTICNRLIEHDLQLADYLVFKSTFMYGKVLNWKNVGSVLKMSFLGEVGLSFLKMVADGVI